MVRKQKPQASKLSPTAETIQATSSRPSQIVTPQKRIGSILQATSTSKAFALIALAAIYPALSQLILSPVYGSIPSAIYHKYGLIGSTLAAFALRDILPKWMERGLPAFAFWIPTVQLVLLKFSNKLGNPIGPLVTELVTCFPLVTWSLHMAGKVIQDVDLSFLGSDAMEEAAPSMIFYMLFTFIQRIFKGALPQLNGTFGFLSTRIGMQLVIATMYGLMLPGSLFWPALPSIVVTMTLNVHNSLSRTTEVLNNTLALHNFKLLERHESLTGYISVFENNERQYRAMRCDHSLLGGQWIDDRPQKAQRKVAEPIYAVFTMMEAVRLVEHPKKVKAHASAPESALNIGLGIGTAPSALIAHGVKTTVVELDPVVHYLAGKYFGLPANHSYFLGDAVYYVDQNSAQVSQDQKFDYILHDVFTGGAVPTSLFTYEFLTSLSKLLKSDGTIAINYAGDLNQPSASMIHNTISSVFKNCRIFREEPEASPKSDLDFTNLVYFCAHPDNGQPIKFRKPVAADYLGSGARQQFLVPKHELNPSTKFHSDAQIVRKGSHTEKELEKWQVQSALGHWRLMKNVVPDVVWENW